MITYGDLFVDFSHVAMNEWYRDDKREHECDRAEQIIQHLFQACQRSTNSYYNTFISSLLLLEIFKLGHNSGHDMNGNVDFQQCYQHQQGSMGMPRVAIARIVVTPAGEVVFHSHYEVQEVLGRSCFAHGVRHSFYHI